MLTSDTRTERSAADELRAAVSGGVALPSDQAYADACRVWNGAVQHRPEMIAFCERAEDVQAAVRVARRHGLPLSVRGGGHDWAGRALRSSGLVIDLTRMRQVAVDPRSRIATVAGGARVKEVAAAASAHGLVAALGNCGTVGIGGLTLGGGYGPLSGSCGLAADNLLGAEVVLADGRCVTTGPDEEPDLFWALRGGGGNFGVVAAMRVRLHEARDMRAGSIIYPWSEAVAVLRRYGQLAATAPSGTTGQPKLVVHTPATLAAIAVSFAHLGLDGEQVALLGLPMVHGAGFSAFLGCVHFGAPVALLERFDPDVALDAVEAHRCSWMMGLPFMFAELLQHQQERPREVGSLRHCLSAGDVCPEALQQEFADVFDVPVRSVLASSEIGWSLTYGLQPGPVSRVPPGTGVRVVDDAGAPVPYGETGELLVRSPSVSPGYWTGPGRLEGAPKDGWCRTGDLVRQGHGDDLWFVSRKKDLIVRGGSNIAPAEVEQVLLAHPAVRDAAAVGVPDPVLGQRVAALVQLAAGSARSGAVLDSIRAKAAAQLAGYKVPERLHAVDAIPRNTMGKVDRAAALLALSPGTAAAGEGAAVGSEILGRSHQNPLD